MRKAILPVIAATIWISLSEFVRNEFIVKSHWINHYQNMGLSFPSEPLNGAMWGVWSLFFAIAIYIFSNRFNLIETCLISWFIGFVMMWVVIGNLGVLPYGTLTYAIPLSLLETYVASYIIKKLLIKEEGKTN